MSILDDPLVHLLLFTARRDSHEDPKIDSCSSLGNYAEAKPAYLQKHNRNTGTAKLKRAAKHLKRSKK